MNLALRACDFSVSETAKYGDVTRGPRVINGNVKSMKSILKEIQNGKFAKEWIKEHQAGLPNYNKLLEDGEKHPIEVTGRSLRAVMPWIPKKEILKEHKLPIPKGFSNSVGFNQFSPNRRFPHFFYVFRMAS